MDDMVRQAMAKWPHVPHCYGWLGLDARGQWYMRDERTQAAGPFSPLDGGTPASKGSLLRHEKLVEFIHRNYLCDELGQWFFQNGPQRVFLELESTPLVWRVQQDFSVVAHIGVCAQPSACLLDEAGHLYFDSPLGLGRVHTQDVGLAADGIEQGVWLPQPVAANQLAQRFGYVRSPQARLKERHT
jgi:Protein of unknown function (DUF2946)